MLNDFKKFIQRGNVIDLAVAVVIGTAFAAVVKAFTENVLMPLIAAVLGGSQPNFDTYTLTLRGSEIRYGTFLTALVSFLLVAFAVFLIVKAVETAENFRRKKEEEDTEIAITEVELLEEIRDLLAEGRRAS